MSGWIDKKRTLLRKQEEFNELQKGSTRKLKRTRVNHQGKLIKDYEMWPAEQSVLQRIANHMPQDIVGKDKVQFVTPTQIFKRLERGEKITTRHGAVYSLVPISSTN